jgi:hypothetical protein
MRKPREVVKPRWRVYRFRKKAARLGSVTAKDAREVIERGMEEFSTAQRERRCISAQWEA